MIPLRLNKRTVLGWQLWCLGAMTALVPSDIPVAVPLIAVGAYLVAGPGGSPSSSEVRTRRRHHIL